MEKKATILVTLLAAFLCIASLSAVASAQCDHNVTVSEVLCQQATTAGWFYNETHGNWNPYEVVYTPLFHIDVDGEDYYGFCINYEVGIDAGNNFTASIYPAEPTCKNNSIAYILNNWIIDDGHCSNVSAGQSAVWYFWYIDEGFCSLENPQYNH
ncbi:MAG: hypothetical protein U9O85_07675, partial [Euryarchaeota archaeon]|nr:hypothetical protein [Euryarchaeota archaeon]